MKEIVTRFMSRLKAIHPLRDQAPQKEGNLDGPSKCASELCPSCAVTERYAVQGLLGHGAFADVLLCEDRETHYLVACKVIDTSPQGRGQFAIHDKLLKISASGKEKHVLGNSAASGLPSKHLIDNQVALAAQAEGAVLKLLTGKVPGVTQLISMHTSAERVELVMEYCSGGDLTDLIARRGRLPETEARVLFRQLVSTLASCHAVGLLHRDIKPENILFGAAPQAQFSTEQCTGVQTPVHAKLADFGVATVLHEGQLAAGDCGTKYFQAPEVRRGSPYAFKADIWSLGVVLYAMLSGSLPPSARNNRGVHWFWMDIQKGVVNLDMIKSGSISQDALGLLRSMLKLDPTNRPTAFELLRHPWVAQDYLS